MMRAGVPVDHDKYLSKQSSGHSWTWSKLTFLFVSPLFSFLILDAAPKRGIRGNVPHVSYRYVIPSHFLSLSRDLENLPEQLISKCTSKHQYIQNCKGS
jgi:hypothetical protein